MKSMNRGFERPAMLAALSAIRLACGSPAKVAENSATLTKKELKTLPASAHLRQTGRNWLPTITTKRAVWQQERKNFQPRPAFSESRLGMNALPFDGVSGIGSAASFRDSIR
jgi:hypothetical protein